MKAYLVVTGAVFGLLGVAHLARLFLEPHPPSDSWFLAINVAVFVIGVGVAVWAARLLMIRNYPSEDRSTGP